MHPYRNMRLVLLFDLPSIELYEKKEYNNFKKTLLKNGYYMMQYSVYVKSLNIQTKIQNEVNKIKKSIPINGNIRLIVITEKQYSEMYVLLGKKRDDEIYNSPERYIKI